MGFALSLSLIRSFPEIPVTGKGFLRCVRKKGVNKNSECDVRDETGFELVLSENQERKLKEF